MSVRDKVLDVIESCILVEQLDVAEKFFLNADAKFCFEEDVYWDIDDFLRERRSRLQKLKDQEGIVRLVNS